MQGGGVARVLLSLQVETGLHNRGRAVVERESVLVLVGKRAIVVGVGCESGSIETKFEVRVWSRIVRVF